MLKELSPQPESEFVKKAETSFIVQSDFKEEKFTSQKIINRVVAFIYESNLKREMLFLNC